ncbi:MAG: TIGR03087 family PEP-CTERM/XrtA system glycosyltransferase [Burkholderiales bacterium]|nr:TIGR03087 family PEP-CTERM/XrtA system glycosyltransferase [Burkholderiales bacterium]
MTELLFLSHRIPYPPNKGDKIRSYHLLKHLARHHTVHLGTFVDDDDDWRHRETVERLCGECCLRPLARRSATLRSLGGLLTGQALSLPFYADAELHRWVRQLAESRPLAGVVVYSSAMAQYAEGLSTRRVADFVDVDSDKWRQYADKTSGPKRWIYRREANRLARWEARIAADFDATFLVSAAEATLMRRIAPAAAKRIHHFDNGVDAEYFSPERDYENPFPPGEMSIVFTGAMDYWPNVDAVTWMVNEVLPGIRARHPEAVFTIVGSRPTDAVRALATQAGVRVTGSVPDVRPFLAHADVAVAPLRIARGVQNKVLEAMAMARSVVVTPQALEGIDATAPHEVRVAASASAFGVAVTDLLDTPAPALGIAARRRIVDRYHWDACLAPVDAALRFEAASGPRSDAHPVSAVAAPAA